MYYMNTSMFRTAGVVGTAAVLLFSATVAFAQERPREIKSNVKPAATVMNQRAANRVATASTTRAAAKERVQAVREEAQTRAKALREKAAARVAEVKDAAKKRTAEKLTAQFDGLNAKWTNHFLELLDRYEAVVEKLQARVDTAAGAGTDATAVAAAMESATAAIESARAAVTAQAARTYTLDVSTVTTSTTDQGQSELMRGLRASFQSLHRALFKDLYALRDGPMKDVRKAVQSAIATLTAHQ